jgi:NurA-like 5'-3' nuclease
MGYVSILAIRHDDVKVSANQMRAKCGLILTSYDHTLFAYPLIFLNNFLQKVTTIAISKISGNAY